MTPVAVGLPHRGRPACHVACISQLPTSPRGARLAANGSPRAAGAIEPVTECGAPFAAAVREPGQSLGPLGEPGSTSAGGGRRRAREGSCSSASTSPRIGSTCICGRPASASRWPATARGSSSSWRAWRAVGPALVVLEATGGFEITVAAALAAAGLPLAVVNPAQIRAFARAIGRLAKTDRLDAELIARFAEQVRPEPRPVLERPGPDPGRAGRQAAPDRRDDRHGEQPPPPGAQRQGPQRHRARRSRRSRRRLAELDQEIDDQVTRLARPGGRPRTC